MGSTSWRSPHLASSVQRGSKATKAAKAPGAIQEWGISTQLTPLSMSDDRVSGRMEVAASQSQFVPVSSESSCLLPLSLLKQYLAIVFSTPSRDFSPLVWFFFFFIFLSHCAPCRTEKAFLPLVLFLATYFFFTLHLVTPYPT